MIDAMNGTELKEMFTAATDWLEKLVPDINALNVYPVPDGDCGTNMLFTMRAGLAEVSRSGASTISSVSDAMAKGSLMGARGNSGVILSQIWRGLAGGLRRKNSVDGKVWADSLSEASRSAYEALSNPVEGTILTVIKDSASAACAAAKTRDSLIRVVEKSVDAARISLSETPNLLPVLKEAGVVDAGGHGFYTLLEGALLYLKGETDGQKPKLVIGNLPQVVESSPSTEEEAYGYCTQFLLTGEALNIAELRSTLQEMGKSLIVVGDSKTVRVHIHTIEPEKVTKFATLFGTLKDIDIHDMDEQHKDFLLMHREKEETIDVSVVAVVNGSGLANVFFDLGVSAIVPGGQTMNPSTMDILQAVEAVRSKNIIILPNNKNIIPTANQVQNLTKKLVSVIPTTSVPQGVTALIAFSPEADYNNNLNNMTEAYSAVKTIEITSSTRTMNFDGLNIKAGQIIGLLDGKLIVAGDTVEGVILEILSGLDLVSASVATVYYGENVELNDASNIGKLIIMNYSQLELEVINGGQPHYSYIISVE